MAHNSSTLEEPFSFMIGAQPREVIIGWETTLFTMLEGEKSLVKLSPSVAFGEKGLPGLVPPNAPISCELELVRISPHISRLYKSVGVNDSIQEELMQSFKDQSSPVQEEIMRNKPVVENKTLSERKFFDPATMKLDPNQRVQGQGRGHRWTETAQALELEVPLPPKLSHLQKKDLVVDIRSDLIFE